MKNNKVNFIITCHGWSASKWFAAALNLHNNILCVHSVGELMGETRSHTKEEEAKLSKQGKTIGRYDKSLDEHFENLHKKGKAIAYGSVHRYRLRDLPKLGKVGFKTSFQIVNLIRHPVNLVNSGMGQFINLAKVDPHARYEILSFFKNEAKYYEYLGHKYGLDLCDWSVMSFLAACSHMFVLVHDLCCVKGVANVQMEKITTDRQYFSDVVSLLTKKSVHINDEYLDIVFSTSAINQHKKNKPILKPEQQYLEWDEWQKEAFAYFMQKSKIADFYTQLGYNFTFVGDTNHSQESLLLS